MLGWQESYLNNSKNPLARCAPSDNPVLAPGDTIDFEHGSAHNSPLKLFVAGGCTPGNTGDWGVDTEGAGGAGRANDASAGWE
jgi:hypothetical protein